MEYPVISITEELKIINLVLDFIPIDAELKKNLNITAIALALKLRLSNIAHTIVANDSKEKEPSKLSKGLSKLSNMSYLDILKLVSPYPHEESKIDMVVKRTVFSPWFTIGKYYPVVEQDNDGYYKVIDDDGHGPRMDPENCVAFKVGDRFKHNNNIENLVEITAFEIEHDNIRVHYFQNYCEYQTSIKHFDENLKCFTKIEPTEEKESIKQEELKDGDCVEILSDALVGNTKSVVEEYGVKSAIGFIGIVGSSTHTIPMDMVAILNLPDKCYDSRFDSWAYKPSQLKKVDKPKAVIPKFHIGQSVEILNTCHIDVGIVVNQYYREGGYIYDVENYKTKKGVVNISESSLKAIEPELLPIGTRVRIDKLMSMYTGVEGTIKEVSSLGNYLVALKTNQNIWFKAACVQKLEDPKPEWQPKFKIGDWVIYKNYNLLLIKSINNIEQTYIVENLEGLEPILPYSEQDVELWQPMQKLKDQLAAKIARIESTDLPQSVSSKYKWVELTEFVNNNPVWANHNINTILTHAKFFYQKGDLVNYGYSYTTTDKKRVNNFIFEYAPGITKLMMPICGI